LECYRIFDRGNGTIDALAPVVICVLSNVFSHTSHVTRHTSHVTRRTSHVTRHTSHVTRHTSHVTRHTSHVTQVYGGRIDDENDFTVLTAMVGRFRSAAFQIFDVSNSMRDAGAQHIERRGFCRRFRSRERKGLDAYCCAGRVFEFG
jgi:hypothetical protein